MNSPKSYLINVLKPLCNEVNEDTVIKLDGNEEFNNFLNNVSTILFTASLSLESNICKFTNNVPIENGRHIVFLKRFGQILSVDNVASAVTVLTLNDGLLASLHATLLGIFIPLLQQNGSATEPQLQQAAATLEAGLRRALNTDGDSLNVVLITKVSDEVGYWKSLLNGSKKIDREAAKAYIEVLQPFDTEISGLRGGSAGDLDEVVESGVSCVDELWRLEGFQFPEERMARLLVVIGDVLAVDVQRQVTAIDVWLGDFTAVQDVLNSGIGACEKWGKSTHELCTVFWGPSSERPWPGPLPQHELCTKLSGKLRQVLQVRSIHRQLTRLLSSSEQKELATSQLFDLFKGLQPGVWSPYTEEDWKLALVQFDKALQTTEQRVAGKLRLQLRHLNANTLQLLQELQRYKELLKRPRIAAELIAERENLLGLLVDYIASVDVSGGDKLPLLDMPPVVSNIYWARQLKARMVDVLDTNAECLSDLKGSQDLHQKTKAAMKELTAYENEEFDSWVREIHSGIKSEHLKLSGEGKVLDMNGQMVVVNYSPRLGRLVREVQQLSVLGLSIPSKIQELYHKAVELVKQANTLEQIAHFHNTIGDRMIASQRPMMLAAAQALERLITAQTGVTWAQTSEVDAYIAKLQLAVENLSRQNNKLAFCHGQITQKVVQLMDTDLIKQQAGWKSGLRDIRDMIMQVEEMEFTNMKSWRAHWDFQIYKALEHQYQLSLAELHTNLPEMKVQLVYRLQKLQFQPPIEDIKMKYYGQVKRFLNVPNAFRGVADNTSALFRTIVERNAHRFGAVFFEAESLFERLEGVRLGWRRWVALGGFSLEELAAEHLDKAEDWDFNFRASKNLGQEIAKLPCDDVKVGCITVSLLPIRTEMELQNRRYWDALTSTLQASVLRHSIDVADYMEQATASLNAPRHSMNQVAEAYGNHARIVSSSHDMLKSLEETIKMNKTLASWTKEKMEVVAETAVKWDHFQSQLTNFESLIGRQVESMKVAVQGQTENLLSEADKFRLRWEQVRPRDTDLQDASPEQLTRSLTLIKEKNEEFMALKTQEEQLKNDYAQLGLPPPDLESLAQVAEDLEKCSAVWSLYEEFTAEMAALTAEDWILFRSKTYRLDDLLKSWEAKVESEGVTPMAVRLLHEIQSYKSVVPLLKYVRGEAFSDRHWMELLSLLDVPQKPAESLTLGDLLTARERIVASEEALQELNGRAASEIAVRQALTELDAWEVTARFSLAPHTDAAGGDLTVIKDFGEVLGKLADQQCLVQSVARSGGGGLVDRAEAWERKLVLLEECVKALSTVQRKWIYLEPIFGNGSFTLEMPRFQRVDQDLRHIMADVAQDSHVAHLSRIPNLRQTLTVCLDQLARCQAGLDQYLQEKRSSFPRFYFLGDDDLLELLGQASKERVIQAHAKKLFAGIHTVSIEDGVLSSISSLQGEVVTLKNPVKVTNSIEEWLSALNLELKSTLQNLLLACLKDDDPTSYPCQILCLSESIRFAANCESAITSRKLREFLKTLKDKISSYSGTKVDWENDPVLALKLKSLLVDAVHHVDIVEELIVHNVSRVDDWHWQKRLRFYVDGNGIGVARMADAEFVYSYEYQGTGAKLVRTPLTERCFLTLTQAMRSGLGGNPYGPAGTGKTESVKALGALLGRQVLVFNCDEGIDVESMARIFVGLVKCGAWGCFDEFNRLEETTLSGVSMLIQPILTALREGRPSVRLLAQDIPMDLNCAIYVTLNPAGKGYGGRQKLPDNLKALFRPVAMSAPDNLIIAQVSLLCDGYASANVIGRKLVELFDFCQHSLSQQDHYDWGLRALKTVLGSCGSLLRDKSRGTPLGEAKELETAVEAVRFNTLSKLTFADAKAFDQLVRDVFVGVEFVISGFADLTAALAESYTELGLQLIDRQVKVSLNGASKYAGLAAWTRMAVTTEISSVKPAHSRSCS